MTDLTTPTTSLGVEALKFALYRVPSEWTTLPRLFAVYVAVETSSTGRVALDAAGFAEKYGVAPSRARNLLAMMAAAGMITNLGKRGGKSDYRLVERPERAAGWASMTAVRNVLRAPNFGEFTAAERLVLLVTAARCDSTLSTTVRDETVARLSGVDVRTVNSAWAKLAQASLLRREDQFTAGGQQDVSTTYLTEFAAPVKPVKPRGKAKASSTATPSFRHFEDDDYEVGLLGKRPIWMNDDEDETPAPAPTPTPVVLPDEARRKRRVYPPEHTGERDCDCRMCDCP